MSCQMMGRFLQYPASQQFAESDFQNTARNTRNFNLFGCVKLLQHLVRFFILAI